jgi:signal transduction histidine kinase
VKGRQPSDSSISTWPLCDSYRVSTTAEILHGLPYFSDLPEGILSDVCEHSEQVTLDAGTTIIEEGTHSEEMYVVVEGQLKVTKSTVEKEIELARLGPGEVVGEIALLDQAPRTATVTTAEPSLLIKVPVEAFEELLRDPRVVRRMFRTVTARLRDIEDTLRHEERMAALGRMAAQLMHELNNPAAAVARSTQELGRVYEELGEEAAFLAGTLADTHVRPTPPERLSALDRGDLEDTVAFWLEERGLDDAWELSPGLVEGGWTPELLDKATTGMSEALTPHFVRWTALRATAQQVIGEIAIGAKRISELVRVVKEYSYLDQAPIQEVDVREGISDTLILLKGKLRHVHVNTEFAEDLAKVEAPGRDLNQVWTNLIDNASDAIEDEEGELRISARNDGADIVVEVSDNGSGMPPQVAERIFDPFYTTKEPGKGTGLGLHTVHSIIGRIGGEIAVESDPSGTTFTVRIPAIQDSSGGS